MTDSTRTPRKRGGLPDDDGLKAFASAASNAFQAPPVRRRKSTPDAPAPEASPAPAPVSQPEPVLPTVANQGSHSAVPAVVVEVQVPQLGERGQEAYQCTIMVSSDVRRRFAHYQLTQKVTTGHEPTNAVVVRRAVLHAKKHDLFGSLREALRHRRQPVQEEDSDPDGLFGEVPPGVRPGDRSKTAVSRVSVPPAASWRSSTPSPLRTRFRTGPTSSTVLWTPSFHRCPMRAHAGERPGRRSESGAAP